MTSVLMLANGLIMTSKISQGWLIGYGLIWVFSGIETMRLAFNRSVFLWRLEAELKENRLEAFHLLVAPFVFLVSFAFVCREVSAFEPSWFTYVGRSGRLSEPNVWIGFMLDQAARAILLDIFETYRVHISAVRYSSNVWVSSLVFVYKTTLAAVFWRFIFLFYEHWRGSLAKVRGVT